MQQIRPFSHQAPLRWGSRALPIAHQKMPGRCICGIAYVYVFFKGEFPDLASGATCRSIRPSKTRSEHRGPWGPRCLASLSLNWSVNAIKTFLAL